MPARSRSAIARAALPANTDEPRPYLLSFASWTASSSEPTFAIGMHRAERLLGHHLHAVVDVGQHGRLDVAAADRVGAAGQDLGALARSRPRGDRARSRPAPALVIAPRWPSSPPTLSSRTCLTTSSTNRSCTAFGDVDALDRDARLAGVRQRAVDARPRRPSRGRRRRRRSSDPCRRARAAPASAARPRPSSRACRSRPSR